ncbi:unnamed protein product [Linum trigynum]|uniref:LysM domain-containing protein n=1 Tax=Linum trigynum TaxID=586398 RepID=A0AAV2FIR3_9ROSI
MDRSNLLALFFIIAATFPVDASAFKCGNSPLKCQALIDHITPEPTTFVEVQTLFAVRNLRTLLGANNLPRSTPPDQKLPAKQTLKIPFPCLCHRGAGISNKRPVYTVKKGDDGLKDIAEKVFSGTVTDDAIAAANGISEKDPVKVGQKLSIPLPCSCDEVEGRKVIHYGYLAESEISLEAIADRYGVSVPTLTEINGLKDGSTIRAGQLLDVPIRACNSSIRSDSIDSQLLVANGTYVFAAHNCVQCKCDSANNWTLQCQPSGVKPSDWSTCPAMECGLGKNAVLLGNLSTSACRGATCSYGGFSSNQTIFTTFDRTCSAAPAPGPSIGGKIGLKNWNIILLSLVHLMVLHLFCIGG